MLVLDKLRPASVSFSPEPVRFLATCWPHGWPHVTTVKVTPVTMEAKESTPVEAYWTDHLLKVNDL